MYTQTQEQQMAEQQALFAAAQGVGRSAADIADSQQYSFVQWKQRVGKNIQNALAKRGVTVQNVPRVTEGRVLYQTVRHCVTGENFPGSRLLWQLNEEFGITLTEVFEGL